MDKGIRDKYMKMTDNEKFDYVMETDKKKLDQEMEKLDIPVKQIRKINDQFEKILHELVEIKDNRSRSNLHQTFLEKLITMIHPKEIRLRILMNCYDETVKIENHLARHENKDTSSYIG